MKICGRCNVRKHRETKNGEKYIILDIYHKIDCINKRGVNSSDSRYYSGRPVKGLNTSLAFRTKMQNNKIKSRFDITDITNHDFSKLLKKFKDQPYLGYNIKQVHNEPTEA